MKIPPILKAFLIIFAVTALAHFMPFERSSLAPDDYANVRSMQGLTPVGLYLKAFSHADRPFNYLAIFLQHSIAGTDSGIGTMLVFVSGLILVFMAYLFLYEVLGDDRLALLSAVFFALLPNTLDHYHTSIYVNMNLAYTLYLASFLFFARSLTTKKEGFLAASLVVYAIAAFWYEIGLLLPLLLLVYAFQRGSSARKVWCFVPISLVYILARGANMLFKTFIEHDAGSIRGINFEGLPYNLFIRIPNIFVGRQMIRAVLYGVYKFFSIPSVLLAVIIVCDAIAVIALLRWLKSKDFVSARKGAFITALAAFAIFLIPNALYTVEVRHTTLASVGLAGLFGCFLHAMPSRRRWLIAAAFAFLLVVSQGIAWCEVVACRINNAVVETIKEHKADILKAERVFIDTKSFADAIPYTWGERQTNVLNCYYGPQVFADWGLSTMVPIFTGAHTPVIIGRTKPQKKDGDIVFETQLVGSCYEAKKIPEKGTFTIDYSLVYGNGFHDGNRWGK